MTSDILKEFNIKGEDVETEDFGSGLINHTWLIKHAGKKYILQKINKHVFTEPHGIDNNIRSLAEYLTIHYPDYLFTKPIYTTNQKGLVEPDDHSSYRLFTFVEGSHSYTIVERKELAYEAAKQFGKFTKLLSGFDTSKLKITLPDFHNLSLRYQQFEQSVSKATKERLANAASFIETLISYRHIVDEYENILVNPCFKKRVTHHDTKISNVLFNSNNKGLCVIDLDTVMPGYFISDVGDMMRTYLSPAGEEETDFSKIDIREDYFEAIVNGYLSEMQQELTETEKDHFIYAGKFMIYMQALRFMADYLNNDIYYGAKYETHNLNRAINQITLLNKLSEKESKLKEIIAKALLVNDV
ncbi:aminoglycoside phosphotransferase family protein [Panacibacter ginsenosidivorans]|uniref:Aminoglycoside phosphotransferase family protein n=1 Tax=Panacibacter ginsenosidivorans TaxID=1813871 RepID=A0A5B8VA17_9BACT|nr:aminoglycoside phosphotransferase family protein [Panacibacter ginsenosidivorans]QEC68182.1 aminoglycoside phosphotransferase family protein [Panacibacter ginsenosidivorans]